MEVLKRPIFLFLIFICTTIYTAAAQAELKRQFEFGVMGIPGGFADNRTRGIMTASGPSFPTPIRIYESKENDNGDIGLQLKEIFDFNYSFQPFIYGNLVAILGTTSSFDFGPLISGSLHSTLDSRDNWAARLGAGIQSSPSLLLNNMQIGAGAGAVVLGQVLRSTINEPSATTTFENKSVTLQPTLMFDISWMFCQKCMWGASALIAAEFNIDVYPKTIVTGTTALGNSYSASISQHWVPHTDIVLSMQVPS